MVIEDLYEFKIGDTVTVKSDPKLKECIVHEIQILDEPMQVLNETVIGYVRIHNDENDDLGYWPSSLEKVL